MYGKLIKFIEFLDLFGRQFQMFKVARKPFLHNATVVNERNVLQYVIVMIVIPNIRNICIQTEIFR